MGAALVKALPSVIMHAGGPLAWLRHSLVRSAAVIAGGTAAAQVIGIATTPILTRLYGPESFGALSLLVGFTTALLPVVGLSYSAAIVIPAAREDAAGLLRLSLTLTFGTCAILGCATIALWLYSPATWKDFIGDSPQEAVVYWMIVPMLLAGGLSLAFQAWLVRTRAFAAISRCTIASAAAGSLIKVIGGAVSASAFTLVVAHTVVAFFSTSLLAVASLRNSLTLQDQRGSGGRPAELSPTALALAYRGFPLYTMPRDLLNGISAGFPAVMFATFADVATSGLYGLARTVLSVPASLVTQSLATALLPHLAGFSQKNRSLRPPLLKAMAALALVGLPIFGPLFFVAPPLFRFIFGAEWEPAGEYAQWLSLWCYCTFIDLPCAQAVRFLGLQRAFLIHELIATFCRLAAVYVGLVWLRDPVQSIMLLSLVGVVANMALVLWVLPCASRSQHSGLLPPAQHFATDDC